MRVTSTVRAHGAKLCITGEQSRQTVSSRRCESDEALRSHDKVLDCSASARIDELAAGAGPDRERAAGQLILGYAGLVRRELIDRGAELAGDDDLVVLDHVGTVLRREAFQHRRD